MFTKRLFPALALLTMTFLCGYGARTKSGGNQATQTVNGEAFYVLCDVHPIAATTVKVDTLTARFIRDSRASVFIAVGDIDVYQGRTNQQSIIRDRIINAGKRVVVATGNWDSDGRGDGGFYAAPLFDAGTDSARVYENQCDSVLAIYTDISSDYSSVNSRGYGSTTYKDWLFVSADTNVDTTAYDGTANVPLYPETAPPGYTEIGYVNPDYPGVYDRDSEQRQWFRSTLASSSPRWKVALSGRNFYSPVDSNGAGSEKLRRNINARGRGTMVAEAESLGARFWFEADTHVNFTTKPLYRGRLWTLGADADTFAYHISTASGYAIRDSTATASTAPTGIYNYVYAADTEAGTQNPLLWTKIIATGNRAWVGIYKQAESGARADTLKYSFVIRDPHPGN